MQATDYIDYDVPFLKDTDPVGFALDLMSGNAVTELPVVTAGKYSGIISEDALLNVPDPDTAVGSLPLTGADLFAREDDHFFEIIRKMTETERYSVPVLRGDMEYLGISTARSVLRRLARNSSLLEPGGIVVLEMGKPDYSLHEIARIVESNDALILSSFITGKQETGLIEVTLKINKADLEDVIASFERYGYIVAAAFHQSGRQDDMQQRFESLMHYLNM